MRYKIKYFHLKVSDGAKVRKPEDVIIEATAEIKNDIVESFYVFGIDGGGYVRLKHLVAKGTTNGLFITPKDVIIPLLHNGLCSAIIVHNHPSGDPEASEEDIGLTRKMLQAFKLIGIELKDHIIIAGRKHFSFKANGLM